MKTSEMAEKSWKDGDYVAAVLPLREERVKPIYVLGYEDGAAQERERVIDVACGWLSKWCSETSAFHIEDIGEFRSGIGIILDEEKNGNL